MSLRETRSQKGKCCINVVKSMLNSSSHSYMFTYNSTAQKKQTNKAKRTNKMKHKKKIRDNFAPTSTESKQINHFTSLRARHTTKDCLVQSGGP